MDTPFPLVLRNFRETLLVCSVVVMVVKCVLLIMLNIYSPLCH